MEFHAEHNPIHLLVSVHLTVAIFNLVGKLNGKSASVLRREFWPEIKPKLWGNHFWSPSDCAVSCGGAPLEIVRRYIDHQRRLGELAGFRTRLTSAFNG